MMESAAAVDTRRILEPTVPIHELVVISALLLDPPVTGSPVVGSVVHATAITTNGLPDPASAMELVE